MEILKKIDEHKKEIIIGLCVLIAVILCIVLIIKLKKPKDDGLQAKLEAYGKQYYSIYWNLYNAEEGASDAKKSEADAKRSEILSRYTEMGINVDLDNLARTIAGKNGVTDDQEAIKNEFTRNGKKCDEKKTKIYFYPESPYGENNFRMEAKLVCE